MTLWLVFALITLAVIGFLLLPLMRAQKTISARAEYDMAIYRDQLAEIDRDIARGLLSPEQASASRVEIQRRMLGAEEIAIKSPARKFPRSKLLLVFIIVIGLPCAAGIMYAFLGSPELPGKPYSGRMHDPDFILTAEAEKLSALLEKNPNSQGYQQLADMYFALRRYDDAAGLYHKMIDAYGGTPFTWAELGEVIALSQNGMVVPEAYGAFVKALQIDPHESRAFFYLGVAQVQAGHPRRAVAIWRQLEKDSPPGAPWLVMIKDNIEAVSRKEGFDPESITPATPSEFPLP